ncbi:MAG: tetratricopeptide repeat protein [Coxiellaceae bacterium]|nr:MAG: tetratricopeptide repeat protein [Coxiellaceae bacterium]
MMVTKGDILVALGKNEAARRAYGIALQVLPNTAMIKPFVQMKYDALATAEKAPTESTSKNNE